MKAKMIGGKRFLFRSRHKQRGIADKRAESLKKSGRQVRIIEENNMFCVYATSIFD